MNPRNDPFFRVPKTAVPTSQGDVALPICYYDASNLFCFFTSPVHKVRKKLAGTGLAPGLVFGNKAIVVMAFYEYRETDIGPYNEVGLAIPVFRENEPRPMIPALELLTSSLKRKLGFYVVDLPVTTEVACTAGRELWGFPKFVTVLPITFDAHHFEGTIYDPKTHERIAVLSGELGLGIPTPGMDLVLYSRLEDEELRTIVNVRYRPRTIFGHKLEFTLGASQHPMTRNLRDLELDGAHPLFAQVTNKFQSRLHAGRAIEG